MYVQIMGYRNEDIGATKGGLGCAECRAAVEKSMLKRPKTAQKTFEGTLEERSRYRLALCLGVLNQQ
jgi:ferredoxin